MHDFIRFDNFEVDLVEHNKHIGGRNYVLILLYF
jgi:hypothetical protein